MSLRVLNATAYLVGLALSGRGVIVSALYDYFTKNESPSRISARYGVDKTRLRGYINRFVAKVGSHDRARTLLSLVYPRLCRVKPVVVNNRCTICYAICCERAAHFHVLSAHRDLVMAYTYAVLSGGRSWGRSGAT